MKVSPRIIKSRVHSFAMEDDKCIITRNRFPKMKVLYDPQNRMGSIIEKEPNVSEEKIQGGFGKALAWARNNLIG